MVSIIVPTYNLESYIENCLDSLVRQTYKDIEIIVVDDGSTDNTVEVVTRKLNIDDRIKLCIQKNGGAAKARNKGLDLVKGDYIIFVDGDDMLEARTIEDNLCILSSDLSIDWCAFSIIRTDSSGQPIFSSSIYGNKIITDNQVLYAEDFVPAFYKQKLSGVCCGAIYRKSSINCIRFPEGEFYEDGFFFTDLLSLTSKGYLSCKGKYLYVHRPGSSQLQKLDKPHLMSDLACSIKKLKQFRDRFPQYEDIYAEWENTLYYFYKNEVAKKTEGAKEIYETFKTQMKHKPKRLVVKELKFMAYRFLGYKNIRNAVTILNKI